ncbi:hypothetical protein GUJ93_ZPchr0009g1842 [Zizania palustris]|uniref:Uncharacterized protein n=1 Tax=Zizania palustris TaxID=103762 RepID=A0A8J5RQL0_ZIZPA|nr:hypothetical protein GUJ93_ZPchr0009g1842 [Zizania palustris]
MPFNPRFSFSLLPLRLRRLRPPPRPPAASRRLARLPGLHPAASAHLCRLRPPPRPPAASAHLHGLRRLRPPPPPPRPPVASAHLHGLRRLHGLPLPPPPLPPPAASARLPGLDPVGPLSRSLFGHLDSSAAGEWIPPPHSPRCCRPGARCVPLPLVA